MLHAASAPQQPPARRRLLGITGRGGRELLDTEQPADRVEGGGDMHVRVGVQAAGDGAGVYAMVTVIPSQVDGWHAPLAARTRESWPLAPLARARQIRPSAAPTNWWSLAFVMSQPPMTFLTAWRPDRARLENCRAPDTRRSKHGLEIRSFGAQLVAAADRYKAGLDRRSFDERFSQSEPPFHGQRRDVISDLCGRSEAPVVRARLCPERHLLCILPCIADSRIATQNEPFA